MAAAIGVGSAAPATVFPGVGTVAMVGASGTDVLVCLGLQANMCTSLAAVFNHDVDDQEVRLRALMLAGIATLSHAGGEGLKKAATKASINLLRNALKGATLQTVKQVLRKVGITFTRKALEKAVPFGIGMAISGSANYAITRFVGVQAKRILNEICPENDDE